MTPLTLDLSAREQEVVKRAGQPGTYEFVALESVVGHSLAEEFESNGSPERVLKLVVDAIEERAAKTGYAALAERVDAEDESVYDAMDALSREYLLED